MAGDQVDRVIKSGFSARHYINAVAIKLENLMMEKLP